MDQQILDEIAAGDRKTLSRAITMLESGAELDDDLGSTGRVIGVTGPPGAGKSTLLSALVDLVRSRGETVAILAVDPSSPITGGAILGDRIRMQSHVDDPGVFIRSMAARGHLGGLAEAAGDAIRLMDLAGFDWVIVETVGVGQSEVEVMDTASVVVLVVGPSWGDQIQADKAGIVEITDLFVVNKGDRPGAGDVKRALQETADARGAEILVTTAVTGEGVGEVLAAIDRLGAR